MRLYHTLYLPGTQAIHVILPRLLTAAGLLFILLAPFKAQAAATAANPYGLAALWSQGDMIAKGTLVLLVLMSLASWYVIFSKLVQYGRIGSQSRVVRQKLQQAQSVGQVIQGLKSGSIYYQLAHHSLLSAQQYQGVLTQRVDLNTWLGQSIQRSVDYIRSQLFGGLSLLATVGSTAPFIGLFGTVWGIYHALTAIGISGQASIDKVAGPVGEALIMTAIGLAVAVPAVLGYNALLRRNKKSLEDIHGFADEVHALLLKDDTLLAPKPGFGEQ